jgi:hypothetical protein
LTVADFFLCSLGGEQISVKEQEQCLLCCLVEPRKFWLPTAALFFGSHLGIEAC